MGTDLFRRRTKIVSNLNLEGLSRRGGGHYEGRKFARSNHVNGLRPKWKHYRSNETLTERKAYTRGKLMFMQSAAEKVPE